jgi:GTP diphosphokinase / guanosine-3',5'-bis(diphosphate) 3'-diphosphatase
VSAKARAAIRHYLKSLKRKEAIELGRRLLNQALAEFSLTLKKVADEQMKPMLTEFGMKSPDELYEKIGLGERLAPLIARRLLPIDDPATQSATPAPLAIAGTEGLVISYARCCFPIPNDPVMAYLSSGRGIVVHRESCGNLSGYRKQPDKWISLAWEKGLDRLFSSEIRVEVANRMGVLAAVAASIAGTETNIDHVSLVERDVDTSSLIFELQVRDRKHLARVMRTIRNMPDVLKVLRTIT